jgi:hypothetical protein
MFQLEILPTPFRSHFSAPKHSTRATEDLIVGSVSLTRLAAVARDTQSRHVEPSRRLMVGPLCGSAPIDLLEAANEDLRRDQAEAVRVAYVAAARERLANDVTGQRCTPIGASTPRRSTVDSAYRKANELLPCGLLNDSVC